MDAKKQNFNWIHSIFDADSENSQSPLKRQKIEHENEIENLNKYQSPQKCELIKSSKSTASRIHQLSQDWINNFTPQTIMDLAVHIKKIEELQNWLQSQKKSTILKSKILLLTGPSGCGKTATVHVLSKLLNYECYEWITPIDIDLRRQNKYNNYNNDETTDTFNESQIEKFSQFLFRASRYNSVVNISNSTNNNNNSEQSKRLVLVEDFPQIYLDKSNEFIDLIDRYYHYGKSPLIFIVTDTKSKTLDISYKLFTDTLKEQYKIEHISFNSVSVTLLKKGLKRVQTIIQNTTALSKYYKELQTDILDSIILTCKGDIRNAIINLHLISQKDATKMLPLENKELSNSHIKKTTKQTKKFKTIGSDETVTMFHSIGRVLNPKYIEDSKSSNKKILSHSPEIITDSFLTEPNKFMSILYTNYLGHFSNIEDVANASNILSISDNLFSEWRDDSLKQIGLNLAIRGLMIYNEKPMTGWIPIKGKIKHESRTNLANEMLKLGIDHLTSVNALASEYKTYANIIKK